MTFRGYGHVKEKAMKEMAEYEAELWTQWPKGGKMPVKTRLIG